MVTPSAPNQDLGEDAWSSETPPVKSTWSVVAAASTGVLFCLGGPGAFLVAVAITEMIDDEMGALSMIIAAAVTMVAQLVVVLIAVYGFIRREPLRWLGIGTFAIGFALILFLLLSSAAAITEFL